MSQKPTQSRLQARFEQCKLLNRTALIPFITAGDPFVEGTVEFMHALVDSGADVLELGVPFSDPMADGPVIQVASERAIEKGVSLTAVLGMVKQFRQHDQETPVVLMGYLNPVYRMGFKQFAELSSVSGVDAVLLVDSPPEESQELEQHLTDSGTAMIRLVAPTTTAERMKLIAANASGFIYYVAIKGTTGTQGKAENNTSSAQQAIGQMRDLSALPVAVGFGIQDAQSAVAWASLADAVVIGSALVSRLAKSDSVIEGKQIIKSFLAPIRVALDNAD